MNVLDRILKRSAKGERPAEQAKAGVPEDARGKDGLRQNAESAAQYLLQQEQAGKLHYDVQEYIESREFPELLNEYGAEAAVRIYEAERIANEAYEAGREDAIDEIYRRREMPRSMRSGTAVPADVDYMRMSGEEFMRLKDRLSRVHADKRG